MNHRPNSRPLVLSRLNHTLLNEVVKVALLRVVVVVLGLGPVVDTVDYDDCQCQKSEGARAKKAQHPVLEGNNVQNMRGGAT